MKSYLITLKLGFPEESYINLITYLKSANTWARPIPNVWMIKTPQSSTKIRDGLMAKVNKGDQILVTSIPNNDWATSGVSKNVTDWMKSHL